MLDILVVKVYRYIDERNYYMEANDYLWQKLIIPEGVKVVTMEAARKFRPYDDCEKMYCWQLRPYYASLLLKEMPAEWVAVFDADVLPSRKDALVVLSDKLKQMPNDVVGVCYQSFWWQQRFYPPTVWFRMGFSGYAEGVGDGIHILRASYLDKAVYKYIFLSWLLGDKKAWCEHYSPSVWHPMEKVAYLGGGFCFVCKDAKDAKEVFKRFNPCFIHHVDVNRSRTDYLELLALIATMLEAR